MFVCACVFLLFRGVGMCCSCSLLFCVLLILLFGDVVCACWLLPFCCWALLLNVVVEGGAFVLCVDYGFDCLLVACRCCSWCCVPVLFVCIDLDVTVCCCVFFFVVVVWSCFFVVLVLLWWGVVVVVCCCMLPLCAVVFGVVI